LQTRLDQIFESETKNFKEAKKVEEKKRRKQGNNLGSTAGSLPTIELEKKKKKKKERKSVTLNLVSKSAFLEEWPPCSCGESRCHGCPYE
jgi:hypothetical protein